MSQLQFHPVWEDKLTTEQKEEFEQAAEAFPIMEGVFDAVLVRGKYKKNGGAVATVLLRNGMDHPLSIERIAVEISDAAGDRVAAEEFAPNLQIAPDSVMPWSFVFTKGSVNKREAFPETWKVAIVSPKK